MRARIATHLRAVNEDGDDGLIDSHKRVDPDVRHRVEGGGGPGRVVEHRGVAVVVVDVEAHDGAAELGPAAAGAFAADVPIPRKYVSII